MGGGDVPVGFPLKGTTMSFSGPPEACVTGMTPAACVDES